ncbi:lysophospholipid acyltransferase family protein [Solwaraspora sp. WMMB335]|uniref:lysophospholipid acyltransferase family protein n=1 Tax=Solwaraspora sp. WMMB335 TaxID=3404118 RepID=UPI003B95886C
MNASLTVPTTFWRPRSGCGPGCLPPVGTLPAAGPLTPVLRLAGVLAMLLTGVFLLVLLPVLPRRLRPVAGSRWARGLLRAFGVRLRLAGRLPRQPALLAANHISWLDTLAILAVAPVRMLAKSEVGRWPMIGSLARVGGTLFIDRDRPRTLPRTVAQVAAALRAGSHVAVFPQGTTTCGIMERFPAGDGCASGRRDPVPFRPALFQAAVDAGAPVVPLTLTYHFASRPAGRPVPASVPVPAPVPVPVPVPTSVTAFIGEEALWPSARRILALRHLVVTVDAGVPLRPDRVPHRRALARLADPAAGPIRSALDLVA